jgi:hypothetical protein
MTTIRLALAVIALALPADAVAQSPTVAGRFEIGGAAGLHTQAELGRRNGDLRANSTPAQPFTLFTTDSTMSGSWLGDVRVGFVMSRRVSVEGRLGYSRPTLETSVGADTEGAASITVVERVDQYVIDAGVVVSLDEMRFGRIVPYAAGGAGYLRQLHEGFAVIEQGHMYHVGGGLKRDLITRDRRLIRAAGLRVDARMNFLAGGISLGDAVVTQGTLAAGLYLRF